MTRCGNFHGQIRLNALGQLPLLKIIATFRTGGFGPTRSKYQQHRGQTLHACARPQKSAGKTKANCIQMSRTVEKNEEYKKIAANCIQISRTVEKNEEYKKTAGNIR